MAPEALICKECEPRYPLEARYVCERCFGPLEVAYDFSGLDPAEAKRKIQAGSRGIWRYADFLPFAERPRDPLEPGLTPLVRADRLAERLGLGELWIKNDAANPTHSFKDRVVAVALAKARELGFETVACASTGNLANAVAAHAAAAGPRLLRVRARRPRGAEAARHGRLRHAAGRRPGHLRRRQPPLHRALRDAALGVRQRQPAPLLLRGLEDARLRDRRAARLVAARPGRLPDRLGLAVHEDRAKGSAEWLELGLVEGELPAFNGAQAAGCSPVATAFAEGWDACKPQRPDTIAKSLAIGNPADGVYALDLARRTGGAIDSVTDDEIRDGIRLLAETTGIFTETAGGVTVAVLAKLAERGDIDRLRARRRLHHRRGAEDARRDPGGLPDARDRADAGGLRGRAASRVGHSRKVPGRWRSP